MRHCPLGPKPCAVRLAFTGEVRLQCRDLGGAGGDDPKVNVDSSAIESNFMTDEGFDPGDAFRERAHAGVSPR